MPFSLDLATMSVGILAIERAGDIRGGNGMFDHRIGRVLIEELPHGRPTTPSTVNWFAN
jgi:hypothetical protein